MKKFITLWAILVLAACTTKPSTNTVKPYADMQPTLKLQDFFEGTVKGYGIVFGRGGDIKRRFDVTIEGTWDNTGKIGTLDEKFTYYDGETDTRVWKLEETAPNQWQGKAGDTIGIARGYSNGNAFHWQYKMAIKVGSKDVTLLFDDWMYLMNDGKLLNKTAMKKFGVTVAELVLFMEKVD